jgi:hypothetical protein
MLKKSNSAFCAGLLGIALLVAVPVAVQADQGKWWTPKEEKPRVRTQTRQREPVRVFRRASGEKRVWRSSPRYGRVYRDYVVVRGVYGGPYQYRARRYWVRPAYSAHYIYVRPVRYFVAASAVIGGVRISARFHPHDYWLYGCNFCDARFENYDDWAAHVGVCRYHPDGYQVRAQYWDDDGESYGNDDRGWTPDE